MACPCQVLYFLLQERGTSSDHCEHPPARPLRRFHSVLTPDISQQNQVIYWYRAHPKGVSCPGLLPRNSNFPADSIFALALLKDASTISLDVGSSHYQWTANPGISTGSVPFPAEDSQIPYVQIIRSGVQKKYGYGSTYITKSCSYYNFNPFIGLLTE